MITENELIKFLDKANRTLKFENAGCMYLQLGDGLFVVCAYTNEIEGGSVIAKIAYNCDSLQCDYDYDWYFPVMADGDLFMVEEVLTDNDLKMVAHYFLTEFAEILDLKDTGDILDWNE